jgi:hypothetical protein
VRLGPDHHGYVRRTHQPVRLDVPICAREHRISSGPRTVELGDLGKERLESRRQRRAITLAREIQNNHPAT